MTDLTHLKAGDSVWKAGQTVRITKVGRVWMTLEDGFRHHRVHGGPELKYVSRAYLSEADRDAEARAWKDAYLANVAWDKMKSLIAWRRRPATLTADRIREIGRELGVDVP